MTITEEGKICNWCGKLIIPIDDLSEDDKQWPISKCYECIDKVIPIPKKGNVKDLPEDFWGDGCRNFGEYINKWFDVESESITDILKV